MAYEQFEHVPEFTCHVAFDNGPWDVNPLWYDLSARLRSVQTRRGRPDELSRFDTGTATFVLDNRDGELHNLPGSTLYPRVTPFKLVRLGARTYWPNAVGGWDVLYQAFFTGHIESFEYVWSGTHDAAVRIQAADTFKALGMRVFQWEPPQEQIVTDRLYEALTGPDEGPNLRRLGINPGWLYIVPTSYAEGGVGISALQFVDYTGVEYGQMLALAEGGRFFSNHLGKFEFHPKSIYWKRPWSEWGMVLGDAGDNQAATPDQVQYEWGYRSVTPQYDDSRVYNKAEVLGHGRVFFAENLSSIAKYGPREMRWPDMPFEHDIYGETLARWLTTRYSEPKLRFTSIQMQPDSKHWWTRALGLEIGRKVLVRRRVPISSITNPAAGVYQRRLIEQPSYIEGVAIDATPERATITWTLAPSVFEGPWAAAGVYYLDDEARRVYVENGNAWVQYDQFDADPALNQYGGDLRPARLTTASGRALVTTLDTIWDNGGSYSTPEQPLRAPWTTPERVETAESFYLRDEIRANAPHRALKLAARRDDAMPAPALLAWELFGPDEVAPPRDREIAGELVAYISEARWVADCPDPRCRSALVVTPDDPRFLCCACRNQANGGRWYRVAFPVAKERGEIERLVLRRPEVRFVNWLPGESVADVRRINREHGVR